MLEQEILVGTQYGNVMLSFKTDPKGSNLKEGFESIAKLISSNRDLFDRIASRIEVREPRVSSIAVPIQIQLSELGIPQIEREEIVKHIDSISRFELFILLLHYAGKPLGYTHVMSLSKELGKPIRYNWLDSEPHRKQNIGFIKSDPIPGKKEKLYSLTERGKQRARAISKKVATQGHDSN